MRAHHPIWTGYPVEDLAGAATASTNDRLQGYKNRAFHRQWLHLFDSHATTIKLAISNRHLKRLYLFGYAVMFKIGREKLGSHQNTASGDGIAKLAPFLLGIGTEFCANSALKPMLATLK